MMQMVRDRDHAVTVGIGLDHRHDSGVGDLALQDVEVVVQRSEPYQCSCSETQL